MTKKVFGSRIFDDIKFSLMGVYKEKTKAQNEADYWRDDIRVKVITRSKNRYELWVSHKKISKSKKFMLVGTYKEKSRAEDDADHWRGAIYRARVIKSKNVYELWVSDKKFSRRK